MNSRHQLTQPDLNSAIENAIEEIDLQAGKKGLGVFASSHEILGVISQELTEYESAVHQKLSADEKVSELLDIAAAALWGVASIRSGGVDW